jgi:hypothetical protein
MPLYAVILSAYGFHLPPEEPRFWQRQKVSNEPYGAFTTRQVSANDAATAIGMAIESARAELLTLTVETNLDHLDFEIYSVKEIGPGYVGPTRGFTFYRDTDA